MNFSDANRSFDRPWIRYYDSGVPADLEYYEGTMYRKLCENARDYPDDVALEYMNARISYRALHNAVMTAAAGLRALGVRKGDRVTLCLPNIPQAVIAFYGCMAVGAVANMIHPLSAGPEIADYLNVTKSPILFMFNAFYGKLRDVRAPSLRTVVVCGADTYMPLPIRIGFRCTQGRAIRPVPLSESVLSWENFRRAGVTYLHRESASPVEPDADCREAAVILYSGGTSGAQKGILLSHLNFNALAMQTMVTGGNGVRRGDAILAVLPMFHGFGLGVCVHTAIFYGMTSILVPQFNADSFAKLITKKRPAYMAGVPTLYDAILKKGRLDKTDFSRSKGIFCGGDSLPHEVKMRFDAMLQQKHSPVLLREGYGLTECVTASCLTPAREYRRGSVGIPYPDMLYKVVRVGTEETAPVGTDGEICISGPTVMLGYLDQPEETAHVLHTHADGRIWLHTGDLGSMDADGFVYFKSRLKRMVKCSGYSVYPSQVETVLGSHEAVAQCCVIGVPDPYRLHALRAYVVLKDGYAPDEAMQQALRAFCIERIARYSVPKRFVFRENLPVTKVGKVAYTELEQEAAAETDAQPPLQPDAQPDAQPTR